MPEKPQAIQTAFARQLREFKADFVPRVAALQRPVLGNVPVSKDEQRRRFWQVTKGWTPEHELGLLARGMTREDVGLLKYEHRELDAKAGGRSEDDRAQVRWIEEMLSLGPPEPEPFEAEALRIEAERLAEKAQTGSQQPLDASTALPSPSMAPGPGAPTTMPTMGPLPPTAGIPTALPAALGPAAAPSAAPVPAVPELPTGGY